MNYIDYNYYHSTYGGTLIPQEDFQKIATIASSKVRHLILNRDISEYESDVKNATCAVADIVFNQEKYKEKLNSVSLGSSKIISSEKVGDYSRNLVAPSLSELKSMASNEYTDGLIYNTLTEFLSHTGLLYRGMEIV